MEIFFKEQTRLFSFLSVAKSSVGSVVQAMMFYTKRDQRIQIQKAYCSHILLAHTTEYIKG
jgi:hypothetical protein